MWPEPEPQQDIDFLQARATPGGNAAFHNFHNDFQHILDPNQRRRLALAEIDKVPFGWYHVRAVAVAGAGFFADSYDLFAINFVIEMLGISFWQDYGGVMPEIYETTIKAATSAGAVVGQIVFGWLADRIGRKRMYGIELIILVVSTLVQSLSNPAPAIAITGLLSFGRVIMGLGIGGDYPMSAIITSEFAPTRWRGAMMAAVFSMQGAGQFAAALIALLTTVGFRHSFSSAVTTADCVGPCQLAANQSWRIIVGIGAFPAIFALYYRLTVPETPRFTFDVALDIEKAQADVKAYVEGKARSYPDELKRQQVKLHDGPLITLPRPSLSDFFTYFGKWQHGRILFATCASWFFVDFAFYGLGLNNYVVLDAVGYGVGSTVYQQLLNNAIGNLILVCAGAIPGYWLSILTIEYLGRKTIQIVGFAVLTFLFCVIGFGYSNYSKGGLLALYVLAQFFFNFGPNTTTFIIPGECFPTRYRSTCHGLSAASGKIGATIVQVILQPLLTKGAPGACVGGATFTNTGLACVPWLDHLMEIFALFMLCGLVVSFLVPETKGKTLEALAGEEPLPEGQSSSTSAGSSTGLISTLNGVLRSRLPRSSRGRVGGEPTERERHENNSTRHGRRSENDRSTVGSPALPPSVKSDGWMLQSQRSNGNESHALKGQQSIENIPLGDVGSLLR